MRIASEVTLTRLPDRDGPRSAVFISQRPTGTEVSGCVLEAAVQCARGWLLFVTDDVPYEEVLSIYFLAPAGKLLDQARLGAPYTTGTFAGLRLEPPSTVRFQFIGEADWSIEILNGPRFTIPGFPDAKGVWRSLRLTRHIAVHRR